MSSHIYFCSECTSPISHSGLCSNCKRHDVFVNGLSTPSDKIDVTRTNYGLYSTETHHDMRHWNQPNNKKRMLLDQRLDKMQREREKYFREKSAWVNEVNSLQVSDTKPDVSFMISPIAQRVPLEEKTFSPLQAPRFEDDDGTRFYYKSEMWKIPTDYNPLLPTLLIHEIRNGQTTQVLLQKVD